MLLPDDQSRSSVGRARVEREPGARDWRSASALYLATESAHRVTGYLFQGRFASCSRDEKHLGAAARYILLNPVRAHLVERAINYRWSSAAFHAGEKARDALVQTNDLLGLLPDARAWRQLMEGEDNAKQRDSLRQATRTGRPDGDANFIAHTERICGRTLTPQKAGRKAQASEEK